MRDIMNERLSISESNPIRARFYDYDYFKYPWHFHGQYEMMYVKRGEGRCFVGDNIVSYSDGDLIFFGSNLPHYMCSDEKHKIEGNQLRTQGTIIQFEFDFMHYSIAHYPQFAKIKKLLDDSSRGIRIVSSRSSLIIKLMDELPLNSGILQVTNLLILLQEMAILNDKSFLCSQYYANSLSQFAGTRIEKIISYINSNYTRKMKLEEISSMAAMNPSAFCRFFKGKTGMSFMQYLQEIRVGYACKLLLVDRMGIALISIESGFETISHFNRTFKRITGLSPTAYKKDMLH